MHQVRPGCVRLDRWVNAGARPSVPRVMDTKSAGVDARLHLLRANRDAIAVMLGRAAAGGLAPQDAVVIVVDQRDAVGRELAQAAAETAGLDASSEAERLHGRAEIPTAIIVVPLAGARVLFSESHPEVAQSLARCPQPGRVRVVVVAEGAAMLIHAQVSPTVIAS